MRIGRSNADPFAVDSGQGKAPSRQSATAAHGGGSAGTVTCKSAQAKKETETEREKATVDVCGGKAGRGRRRQVMKRRGGGHQVAQSNSQPKLWSGECVLSSAAWIAEAPSFTLTHAHLTSGLSIVYLSGLARSAAHETLQNLRERLGSGTQTQQQQPWYVYTHREKKRKGDTSY